MYSRRQGGTAVRHDTSSTIICVIDVFFTTVQREASTFNKNEPEKDDNESET